MIQFSLISKPLFLPQMNTTTLFPPIWICTQDKATEVKKGVMFGTSTRVTPWLKKLSCKVRLLLFVSLLPYTSSQNIKPNPWTTKVKLKGAQPVLNFRPLSAGWGWWVGGCNWLSSWAHDRDDGCLSLYAFVAELTQIVTTWVDQLTEQGQVQCTCTHATTNHMNERFNNSLQFSLIQLIWISFTQLTGTK